MGVPSAIVKAIKSSVPYQGFKTLLLRTEMIRAWADKRYCDQTRSIVACRYLTGEGIEIGGGNKPLQVPRCAKVRYVDHKTVEQFKAEFPDQAGLSYARVDVVDDASSLCTFSDESLDFVIANHVIEHMADPIKAVTNWLRVLRIGGFLYMAVPDKRRTFDKNRASTPLNHIVCDFLEGPEQSLRDDVCDFLRVVECVPEEQVHDLADSRMAAGCEFHYHVWRTIDFLELLVHSQKFLHLSFDIELAQQTGNECVFVLRKTSIECRDSCPPV